MALVNAWPMKRWLSMRRVIRARAHREKMAAFNMLEPEIATESAKASRSADDTAVIHDPHVRLKTRKSSIIQARGDDPHRAEDRSIHRLRKEYLGSGLRTDGNL